MAPAPSLFLSVLFYCTASKALFTVNAGASPRDVSPFIRSGVIPSEEPSTGTAVEGDLPAGKTVQEHDSPTIVEDTTKSGHSSQRPEASLGRQRHESALSEDTKDSVSQSGPTSKFSAVLGPPRPYVYDRAAKPLSPLTGESAYPLYYTSYHLFAPSLVQNSRPGLEYFGDPPDSYDPLYYGKYQRLAEDVFEQKFVQLRNAGDSQGDLYAETHRQKRKRKSRAH